jgi:uncharacterized protein
MPSNRFNAHADYGIGIGLRTPHYQHIFNKKPVVDWFEIISENFMVGGGVSMYFGSAELLNRDHLRRLSPHQTHQDSAAFRSSLCWGSVDGTYSHDLLPMPYIAPALNAWFVPGPEFAGGLVLIVDQFVGKNTGELLGLGG